MKRPCSGPGPVQKLIDFIIGDIGIGITSG